MKQAKKEILAGDSRWFYKKEKSQSDYNNSGKGTLSVPKLIHNEPCFKKSEPASIWDKKTIILCDWTAELWKSDRIKEVQELIDYLIKQKFNVLIWQDQQLVPFKGPLTEELRKKITQSLNDTLINAAAIQNFTQDQLYLLDDLEINRLIEEKEKSTPAISYSHVTKAKAFLLKQKYKKVIVETFPFSDEEDLKKLNKFHQFSADYHFKNLTIDSDEDLNLLTNNHIITKDNLSFNYSFLRGINSLKLSNLSNSNQLSALLNECKKLLTLDVDRCPTLTKEHFKAPGLESLENLIVQGVSLELQKDIQDILSLYPSLTNLICSFEYDKNTFNEYNSPWPSSLSQLKEATFLNHIISNPSLQNFLQQAPQLRSLNLHYNRDYQPSARPFTKIPLSSLETLKLGGKNVTFQHLENLLQGLPFLKELSLEYLNNLNKNCIHASCTSLEKLKITQCSISSHGLEMLLLQPAGAERLKVLEIYGCKNLSNTLNCPQLPVLEELVIVNSNLSPESLYNLLFNAKNLKKLIITNCPQFDEEYLSKELRELIRKIPDSNIRLTNVVPPSRPANASASGDANTAEDPELHAKVHFFPLNGANSAYNVEHYRLNAYDTLSIAGKCTAGNAFFIHNEGEPRYQNCSNICVNANQFNQAKEQARNHPLPHALGIQEFILGTEWSTLPSLKANEKITHLLVEPDTAQIEICYSERDNLYHVRTNKSSQVRINYLVQLPPETPQALPLGIEQLKNKYLGYQKGALKLKEGEVTGQDYLLALQTQNKGACRHRAIAFKAEMKEKYPQYATRIIANDCHEFVEVNINNKWITCDLGGFGGVQIDYSLKHIKPVEQSEHSNRAQNNNSPSPAPAPISPVINPGYLNRFATWKKQVGTEPNIKKYCQELIQNSDQSKKLIECSSNGELQGLFSAVYKHCKSVSRPVFCINSPEDLICAAPYMRMSQEDLRKGYLTKGPGGPLYEFLKALYQKGNPPLLLVNYSNFSSQDLVRFNALLDVMPKADGIDLPPDALVLGFINTDNPKARYGSDFSSRFDKRIHSPFTEEHLAAFTPKVIKPFSGQLQDIISINLFHSKDWKERLLGRWVLNGKELHFEEGALIPALKFKKTIVIENGLWDNAQFQQFWHQLDLTQSIPQPMGMPALNFQTPILFKKEGYDWNTLVPTCKWDEVFYPDALTLNPTQLSQFFQRYECENKSLKLLPGYLQAHASSSAAQTLHVNVTRSLSDDEWAQWLIKAKELNLKLHLHCAPKISLPASFKSRRSASIPHLDPTSWLDEVISSTDLDTTLAKLQKSKQPLILDISECDEYDLLMQIRGCLKEERLEFEFTQREGALLQALKEGKTVVLKGAFSEELKDALASLLLSRKANPKKAQGRVILVSQDPLYTFLPHDHQSITVAEKLKFLIPLHVKARELLSAEQLAAEPLAQLKARLHYLKLHPDKSSDKAWEGLYHLPSAISMKPLDFNKSKELAKGFTQERLSAVRSALKEQPFVFLTGLTGVGKTTFVSKYLSNEGPLYQGEAKLKQWATDKRSKQKTLFIDEANLSPKQWSEMEGLFNDPPGILIEGLYYPLDKYHKVVFAGNPVTYGDDRTLAPFFARHGNAILFEPLPLAAVYEDILAPLFAPIPRLSSQAEALCKPLLEAYQFLCQCSTQEVLMSPRDMQSMALLISAYCQLHPKEDPQKVAQYYAYKLALPLVPAIHEEHFKQSFSIPEELNRPSELGTSTDFLMTPSRLQVKNLLNDLLMLRHFKRSSPNEVHQYGGLGGLILEGEPGIGKSELVTQVLIQEGYQEIHAPYTQESTSERIFYRIPPSMGIEEKEQLLLKAFHEGAVVVIDEINSSPMMERLLNALLMGATPEGERAKKPGFMVIGTQNPISMAGRIAASTALARRLITLKLPLYTTEEMLAVLVKRGLEEAKAQELILAYNFQVQYAKDKGLTPPPCFRDLLKAAEELIKGSLKQAVYSEDERISKDVEQTVAQPKDVSRIKDAGQIVAKPKPKAKQAKKPLNYSFLLKAGAVLSATLSLAAFVVAALAIALVISLNPIGLGAVIVAGVGAGLLSYALFNKGNKAKPEEKPEIDKGSTPANDFH